MQQQTALLIQARLGSKRLPEKVLRPMGGRPLLAVLLERLRHSSHQARVVVCTSNTPQDDRLAAFCDRAGVACFRGGLDNVAARFAAAIEDFDLDVFVRICADSPLLDVRLVDQALDLLFSRGAELVTNRLQRTFPAGQTVEAMRSRAFLRGFSRMTRPDHLEHVTSYFYEHPDQLLIHAFASAEDWSGLKLSVDTPEDFERVSAIVEALGSRAAVAPLEEIVERFCLSRL